jgi:hypothetical protein
MKLKPRCDRNPCVTPRPWAPQIKSYIEGAVSSGSTVIVDESMQPWVGPHWRADSLIHQREWARALAEEKVSQSPPPYHHLWHDGPG